MSLLIFTAISVDQLLMIHLHLRYNTLVTNKRTTFFLAALLLFSGVFTALNFFNQVVYVILIMMINCTCFITTFISYAKIYRTVIRHQHEIHDQAMAVATSGNSSSNNNNTVLELARFKKRAFNTLCIYIIFLSSYIPYLCTVVLLRLQRERAVLIFGVKNFAVTIIFFNSLVNPLMICWKMRDIRNAMKRLVNCFVCKKTGLK
ncbi:octopamine receptor beta-2R-like [Actinia tenebrosa]|uniref:Octopamine receptor beta-2R-like n=1 Tax=Actinia tenebrosa TaxID=6105 RepID=A0A6P8HWC8_ACTTE|nr:octopamine receptor beta-2R-like [Actinia tenebrosa]